MAETKSFEQILKEEKENYAEEQKSLFVPGTSNIDWKKCGTITTWPGATVNGPADFLNHLEMIQITEKHAQHSLYIFLIKCAISEANSNGNDQEKNILLAKHSAILSQPTALNGA